MSHPLFRVYKVFFLFFFPFAVFAQTDNLVGQIVAADIYDSELSLNKGPLEGLTNSIDKNTIYFKPSPEPASEYFETRPNIPDVVSWRPVYAKIAKSNEWGFTTGPVSWQNSGFAKKHGEYLNIWKRDRKGRWKIALRAEIEHTDASREKTFKFVNPEDTKYFKQRSDSRLKQRAEIVTSTDRLMGTVLRADNAVAYKEFLADNARLLFSGFSPQIGKENIINFLKENKIDIKTENVAVDRSYSGELAYSYGDAKVIKDDRVQNFYYIRVWEVNDEFKWNVLVEMLFEK
ncbi:DUF4440 domain-containing protein [Albibacterium indicum]|uniref:DUF4440 domain-containing protein n=1 Tax=Albibacterium indicum TaxID=2292082 RepID=UPI000E47B1D2|nr:hypothetical protein [Pedobacter indicus]